MAYGSIKALFDSGETQREQINFGCDTSSAAGQQRILDAIATYKACLTQVGQNSLFSPNESLDDLTAKDLRYLLINHRLGDLILRIIHKDRKFIIQQAREAYEKYLYLVNQYDILSDPEKRMYKKYIESPTKFSTIPTSNLTVRRDLKMANFKLEKELRKKLECFAQNSDNMEIDEEILRKHRLTEISLCNHNTFQTLESLNREMEVLMMAPPSPVESTESLERDFRERMGLRDTNDVSSDRLDFKIDLSAANNSPLLSLSGKPLRPFTLLNSRQTIRKNVFRPGHNLPTMTIGEYLEEEKARGGIIEGGGATSGMRLEVDEDNYEIADQETIKAREWDEFKESNHRGSGNTLNRG